MDVQAKTDVVNPSDAAAGKRRRSGDLIVVVLAIFGTLIATWLLGFIDVSAFALIGSVLLTVVAIRWFLPPPGDVLSGPSEAELAEVKRLKRYSTLLDALPQPVMLLDEEDKIVAANAACFRMFGDGVEGAHIASVVRAPNALGALREARHENEARESEFAMTGPEALAALFYVAPLNPELSASEREMVVMVRDRTEQRKLERMRTDFIANASHELRTPLAAILGFIETLQGHAKDDPDARERFLRIMQSQTERMLRLVKDLISLSALELNERRIPEDEVDLCEVAATVREMMAPVAAAAHGEILEGPRDCSALITGDRDQLIQVIQNLTDNALKYGGPEGRDGARVTVSVGFGPDPAFVDAAKSGDNPEQIAVRAGCRPDELVYVRVSDEGDGIENTDLPRLTERFYRIDVERSRSKGGTGLGLAIVKHIVGRHRGGILVESSDGEGAAFTCYFPPRSSFEAESVTSS